MKKALIVSLLSICAFSGCGSEGTKPSASPGSTIVASPAASTRTPEQDLAIIDGNVQGSEKVFASLLDRAEPKCTENRRGIADLSVKAVEVAKGNGAKTSNFDMLTGALKVLDLYEKPQECLGVFAAIASAASK